MHNRNQEVYKVKVLFYGRTWLGCMNVSLCMCSKGSPLFVSKNLKIIIILLSKGPRVQAHFNITKLKLLF